MPTLIPGTKFPAIDLPLVGGGQYRLADSDAKNFTLLVFYRGVHCPICQRQLTALQEKMQEFSELGVSIIAISMDGSERAERAAKEWEIDKLPIAFSLSEETARQIGLFISGPREGSQEPEVFSEPGMFLVKPDGSIFFESIQSAPFTRPPLDELLRGLKFVTSQDYPTRGSLT